MSKRFFFSVYAGHGLAVKVEIVPELFQRTSFFGVGAGLDPYVLRYGASHLFLEDIHHPLLSADFLLQLRQVKAAP